MSVPAVVSALVVDCTDPGRVAAFWQGLLGGWIVSYPDLGVEALRAPGVTFDFVANPDRKVAKNAGTSISPPTMPTPRWPPPWPPAPPGPPTSRRRGVDDLRRPA